MIQEAAANGRADAIITFNRKDFGAARRQFGIAVLIPARGKIDLRVMAGAACTGGGRWPVTHVFAARMR
jgi:hypothetical protein